MNNLNIPFVFLHKNIWNFEDSTKNNPKKQNPIIHVSQNIRPIRYVETKFIIHVKILQTHSYLM